ncbi:MocR-like pyridoxine biosynthesis transcription factor PdxR [Streptomyces sp. NPDC002526]
MPWNTLIDVSREHVLPLTVQIQESIKREIAEGALHPGTRLPSSRQLAEDLRLSRSVVVEAYGQLVAEGYLEAAHGSGTRVAAHLAAAPQTPTLLADSRPEPVARWDLRAHTTDPAAFPEREWLTAYQRAVRRMEPRELGYPPLSGLTPLRTELAGYLGRARGVHTTREHIMVVAGFAQAFGMVCEVLPRLGIDTLAVEDPCHPRQRQFIGESGLRCLPVPVDEDGIDVTALARSGARAVLVTPAHQFPTGVVLSAERRAALVRWAQEADGWIIEDDYDGDLWLTHGRRPTALQRLDPSRVLYAGTASKSLAPGMRLGWLAVPPRLHGPLEEARARRDLGCEALTQLAFAEFLATGLFDRHLRRRRARLRTRAETLHQAVRRHLPGARIAGATAGLHACLQLPYRVDEPSLVTGARRHSVLVRGGRAYHHRPWLARPTLVVGYASPTRTALTEAVRVLGEVCADLTDGRRARTA